MRLYIIHNQFTLVMGTHRLLSSPEIHRAIKAAAAFRSWIPSKHAQQRMIERGFTAPDVECVLRQGVHCPYLDELVRGEWRYRICGRSTDGRTMHLAVVIDQSVIVVTVIGE